MSAATWIAALAAASIALVVTFIYVRRMRRATLSARLVKFMQFASSGTSPDGQYQILVQNLGPASVRLISVEADQDLLAGPATFDVELRKGEAHRIPVAQGLTAPHTVTIRLKWIDSRGKTRWRDETLGV